MQLGPPLRLDPELHIHAVGAVRARLQFQIMYRIQGERELHDQILEHLSGYDNARPVRIKLAEGPNRSALRGQILLPNRQNYCMK